MNKDLNFLIEEKRLNDTLDILNKEILNYIDKRKYITDYIVDYRKNIIEEYKDDEDKIIDYFDHEAYVKEEAFKTIDRKLKEYTQLKETPYFGKVSFKENGEDLAEELYIGRFGLTPEETYEPIIVDWRAPVSSLFYKGTLGESSYEAPEGDVPTDILSRRQFIIKKGSLKGVFDSAVDVKDEILQMVLTDNSSDKLKDIVMTIQEEQDEIIRSPKDKVVVVNGVAGSGKTTIALHRVSYLLYNYRQQFGDKVLILGPNDIFMDYIAQVLPTLGEGGVKETTFGAFASKEINIQEDFNDLPMYIEKAVMGDEEALKEYSYKSSNEFIKELDEYIGTLEKDYFTIKPVTFFNEVIVSIDEINELFEKHYKSMPLFRRSEKIKRILTSKIKDKRDLLVYQLNQKIKEEIAKLKEADYEIEKNNIEFKRRIKIREIIRGVMDSRAELEEWLSYENIMHLYKSHFKVEKLGYMDLAPILYLMIKLDGKKVREEIKHIVIDEAQDYSLLQFMVIKELTGCTSFTIVGDVNQRLIDLAEKPAMLNLDTLFDKKVLDYSLNKSYRSTQEIMEYANQFLKESKIVPLVRHGEKVFEEVVEDKEDLVETILSLIEDYEEEGLESIAVISKSKDGVKALAPALKEKTKISAFTRDDLVYKGGKVLIPAYYAKGLEFDGVILVDDGKEMNTLVKYIMCTRALHRLSIIKQNS
ncbi:MAG: HelD family protein [Clostridium sp.]